MSAKRVRQKPARDPDLQDKQTAVDPQLRDFGLRIRAAREAFEPKMSQTALANKIGLKSKSVVSDVENGRSNATYVTLSKLAAALNLSIGIDLKPLQPRPPRERIR